MMPQNTPRPCNAALRASWPGAIGKHCGFIADDQLIKQMRLGDTGRSQSQTPDQAAALIDAEVDFVAKVPVFAPPGPIRLGIFRRGRNLL